MDLAPFMACSGELSEEARQACQALATSLLETGIVILRDARVTDEQNNGFLDMMEDYFAQPKEAKMQDCHPELHYQVGATPSHVELPICKSDMECNERIATLDKENKPLPITGPDPKWRFFWRIGDRPKEGGFEDLNAAPVIPKAFAGQWETTMNAWGGLMLSAVTTCASMAAVGFGLEADAFTSLMHAGPHLLAPTGSDLGEHGELKTTLAGWHNDLNLLTIHGKSRYPGLHAWLRDGTKIRVKVPDGCLLVQAGLQMEHLTGGRVQAGMHEVIVNEDTIKAREAQLAKGRPAWRISSTLFAHVASQRTLTPLGAFADAPDAAKYPPTSAGEQVMEILKKIELAKPA